MAPPAPDPYAVLGVAHGASDAAIHDAYRSAVRRTHPDAGGSSEAFEQVQEAYEVLRDPARRRRWEAERPAPPPRARPPADATAARTTMEDLLAESQRLEGEARRLAGMRPRHGPGSSPPDEPDSIGAVLHDAGQQLMDAADTGARELRRILRRLR